MGSVRPRRDGPLEPLGARDAIKHRPAAVHAAMDKTRPHAAPGADVIDAVYHLPLQKDRSRESYIEISSSSSPSPIAHNSEPLTLFEPAQPKDLHFQPRLPSQPGASRHSLLSRANHLVQSTGQSIDRRRAGLNNNNNALSLQETMDDGFVYRNIDLSDVFSPGSLDPNDPDLKRHIEARIRADLEAQSEGHGDQIALNDEQEIDSTPAVNLKDECFAKVQLVLPDISLDHVSTLFDTVSNQPEWIIAHVLENVDNGTPYPTAPDANKILKRKRELDEDEEAALKYGTVDRTDLVGTGLLRNM